eukprot:416747_1
MAVQLMKNEIKLMRKQRELMLDILNRQRFTDVMFVIGEEETEYNINRIFLASISDVFEAMLFGQMKESKPDARVVIQDTTPEIFECLIHFAYCNDPKITNENVLLLTQLCDKYQVVSLLETCRDHLTVWAKSLNASNFWNFFFIASALNVNLSPNLIKECKHFLRKCDNGQIGEILNHGDFLQVPKITEPYLKTFSNFK